MRILPVCLHFTEKEHTGEPVAITEAIDAIHQATVLTHIHHRAMMASGLYYFMAREIVNGSGNLMERMQSGLDKGFSFYKQDVANLTETARYGRLSDLDVMASIPENEIRSSEYVVDTLEAAVWSLVSTGSFRECLIKAVNLGDDADTVGAVAGGLAGLYYGYSAIPDEWLGSLQKRTWLEGLCTWDYKAPVPVTDIHAHIIPGIDDGSISIDMTMETINSAYRQGVRGILCTPHADGLIYTDTFDHVQEMIKRSIEDERGFSGVNPWSSRLVCGKCGNYFRVKHRHGKKCWECRDSYRKPDPCKNSYIYETAREWHVKELMKTALNKRPDVVKTVSEIIDRVVKDSERRERVKAAVTEIGRLPAEQLVSDDEDFLLTIKAIRFFPDYHIEVEQVDGSRMEMELKPCWPEKEKRKK